MGRRPVWDAALYGTPPCMERRPVWNAALYGTPPSCAPDRPTSRRHLKSPGAKGLLITPARAHFEVTRLCNPVCPWECL